MRLLLAFAVTVCASSAFAESFQPPETVVAPTVELALPVMKEHCAKESIHHRSSGLVLAGVTDIERVILLADQDTMAFNFRCSFKRAART